MKKVLLLLLVPAVAYATGASFFMFSQLGHSHIEPSKAATSSHMQLPSGWDEGEVYPNSNLTSGAVNPEITDDNKMKTICKPGYTAGIRDVTPAMKKQVFRAYGFKDGTYNSSDYEIDHFVSLELGGLNQAAGGSVTSNLWPEPYVTKHGEPTARQKDVVETTLHRKICHEGMALKDAQHIIMTDWYAYYLQLEAQPKAKKHAHK